MCFVCRLQSTTESKTGTIQRKKVKRKKSSADQKKWLFKGRIATELMEIENLEDGACKFYFKKLKVLISD